MRNVFVALPLVSALLLLISCAGKSEAPPKPAPPPVGVVTVIQQNVPIYGNWVASLDGYINANIQPQVTGYLVKQNYREGSFVHKGDVLFEIDPRPFQAALDQAKGQLAQANGQLAQAQAQLGLARINVKRDTPLAQAHAIAQSQLDNDIQTEKQNEALIQTNQASIKAAEASVETAELNLGFTNVRSLVDGIAGIAATQIGNLVNPSTVLTMISQVNPIKVYFSISEQEYLSLANRIKTRMPGSQSMDLLGAKNSVPIQLTLANNKVYEQKGRILFADRSVNTQTGTIRIIGAFANPGNILRPGQFGRIRALTAMNENALLVPQQAVTEIQGRYQVAVVQPGNTVKIVDVQVGDKYQNLWVIDSGLTAGQRIIAEGTSKVRNGEVVTPQPSQAKPISPYGTRGKGQ
ncbi:MAG TPA: efflux RND transporter periplasmic adaptor subunit [Bryobacteraceae bacterium]|nr:efflux RND transporter periplasmic adaptor subunit [Bryobacteraceae bacterium]